MIRHPSISNLKSQISNGGPRPPLAAELQRIRDTLPATLTGAALHRAIADVLHQHTPPGTRCILFGSEATGKAWRSSDIDIGLISDTPIPATLMFKIQDELESLPTLRVFDLVDFHNVSSEFRENALRDAKPLHEPGRCPGPQRACGASPGRSAGS